MTKPAKLWAWEDAPEELKSLSQNGGDEDWVILVEDSESETGKDLLFKFSLGDRDPTFGWIERHDLEDGRVVFIFSHA